MRPRDLDDVPAFAGSGLRAVQVKRANFKEKRYSPGATAAQNGGMKSAQLSEKGYKGACSEFS